MPFDTLTKQEAAKQLRMSVRTLDKRITAGELAVTRFGRRVLIRTDVLQAWVERCTATCQPHVAASLTTSA